MKREHAISRYDPFALPCLASSSKRQSSAPLQQSCRVATDCALNRLHVWISVTVLPKKRHVSLTPTGKSAFSTHFQRQARPCSLSVRIKEQRLAPRPRKATKKETLSLLIVRCLQSEYVFNALSKSGKTLLVVR